MYMQLFPVKANQSELKLILGCLSVMGQLSELNSDCTVFTLLDSLLNFHRNQYLESDMHDLAQGNNLAAFTWLQKCTSGG